MRDSSENRRTAFVFRHNDDMLPPMFKARRLLRWYAPSFGAETMSQENPTVDEEAKSRLQDASDEYGVPYDELETLYRENYEKAEEEAAFELPHKSYREAALDRTVAEHQESRQTGGFAGEPEEVPIMALGNQGSRDGFGQNDDDIVVGAGIVNPDDREDANMPAGLATFYLRADDGLDRLELREKFRFGNELLGNVAVEKQEDAFPGRKRSYYLASSDEGTFFEDADFEAWPDSLPAKRDLVNEHIVPESDEIQLDALDQSLSQEADAVYGFWYDVKRIEGQVVDAYKDTDKDFGLYKILAEPYGDPEEMRDTAMYSDSDAENDRTPGLQVWANPEQIRCGEGSRVEVYGLLEDDPDSGYVSMTALGIVDLLPKPYDDDDDDSSNDTGSERQSEAL